MKRTMMPDPGVVDPGTSGPRTGDPGRVGSPDFAPAIGHGLAADAAPDGSAAQPKDPPIADGQDDAAARARVKKAPNAFRTISEVADDLHIPQHVLRFWETRFPQVKPLKRGGGRRYYRPDDIALLRRISDLLYIQGYTIKGVQRLLREGGGHLSEDIPPATDAERAAAEAEAEDIHHPQPELLIPGLQLSSEVPRPEPASPTRPPARRRADPETERLRAALADALSELETIRALLG
jgi:DNA-binding transcriptional MerR regulator